MMKRTITNLMRLRATNRGGSEDLAGGALGCSVSSSTRRARSRRAICVLVAVAVAAGGVVVVVVVAVVVVVVVVVGLLVAGLGPPRGSRAPHSSRCRNLVGCLARACSQHPTPRRSPRPPSRTRARSSLT